MMKKESQNFSLKLKLSTILKSPFSRKGKKKAGVDGDGDNGSGTTSSSEDLSTTTADAMARSGGSGVHASHRQSAHTDTTSTARGSTTSLDVNAAQQGGRGPSMSMGGQELGSADGRSQSPAPSQARSQRQSISKTTSSGTGTGENVRVSITVDTIKQQLTDGLQILAEFKKSLRPSSDVQRYDEAVGSFEGAAKGLTTLKSKLSNRKLTGGGGGANRNSYVLPPPDLKVEFEDTPFSMSIPGMEESTMTTTAKESSTLGVVQEGKENEAHEDAKDGATMSLSQRQVWV